MGQKTSIGWTDASWNPIRGCSRVSDGCTRCYAETMAARFSDPGQPYHGLARRVLKTEGPSQPRWTGDVRMIAEHLADPLKWKRPRRIFVNSMSDLFHEKLTNEQIAAVFGVMAACPQHTFQCLTKRAKRMREWFEWVAEFHGDPIATCYFAAKRFLPARGPDLISGKIGMVGQWTVSWPLPSVWIGVSVENQVAADERIPELLATPAAVRFLSCEPMIGGVDLTKWFREGGQLGRDNPSHADAVGGGHVRSGESPATGNVAEPHTGPDGSSALVARPLISWVISGCESGPGARPCSVEWLRALRDQCATAGVPYFLKQAEDSGEDGESAGLGAVAFDDGSSWKAGRIIELPYLDGKQHAAFPETA